MRRQLHIQEWVKYRLAVIEVGGKKLDTTSMISKQGVIPSDVEQATGYQEPEAVLDNVFGRLLTKIGSNQFFIMSK